MSILDQNDEVVMDFPNLAAGRLTQMTKQSFQQMAQAYNQGAKILWTNPNGATPAQITAELGTSAAEVFTLHYLLGQLLVGIKPDSIAEGMALIGSVTLNVDGTVTINE